MTLPNGRKRQERIYMVLDHTEDSATQMQRLAEATNENIRLTELLVALGEQLNQTRIDVLKATTKEEIRGARILRQIAEGKYKETQARIRCQKEIMASIKYLIKAEGSQF